MPEITTFSKDSRGARRVGFTLDGCPVLVTPPVEDDPDTDNAKAFDLAAKLSTSLDVIKKLQAENLELRSCIFVQKQPPAKLLGVGYIRFLNGKIWLLNRLEKGFGEFGLRFDSWDRLFREYDCCVTSHGEDKHGPWWAVESTTSTGLI